MLHGSVGEGGNNLKSEVLIVQLLLNDALGRQRKTLLALDGIAGPKTKAAILTFQRSHAGLFADGRVDPAGATIRALALDHMAAVFRMFASSQAGRDYFGAERFDPARVKPADITAMIAMMRGSLKG